VSFFADWCAIDLLQPDQSIQRVTVAHRDPEKVRFGWQLHHQYPQQRDAAAGVPQVLRTGQTEMAVEIPDSVLEAVAQDPEHLRILRTLGLNSCIVSPLITRGKTLGAISFVMAESDRRYSQADLALAENIAHQVAIAIDNTWLYQAEQMARSEAVREAVRSAEANRIKDEFLAVLSHELRSPLNPILGWSKLLQTGKLDPAKTAYALATIERNAKLQSELIEDLLDVSRILQGKLSLNPAPVNLVAIIQAGLETVRLAAEAKSIQIELQLDAQIGQVSGDAARLQQVLWNLLSNAVKFTPNGGQVAVKLERCEFTVEPAELPTPTPSTAPQTLHPCAQITIRDTGKGIDPTFLPHVFDYFRQEDGATTRKFGGLGLGLAIVHHLVELHGGTVQAESQGEGLGATFTVRLPLLPLQLAVDPDRPTAESPIGLSGLKVLVIDDETDSRDFVAFVLQQAGAQVMMAASAEQGLAVLTQFQPHILLSDVGMPNVDGYMLIQHIRTLSAQQGGTVPAIALTAYAGDFNQQQALQAGFQQHLSKPIEPDELVKAIADLVEHSQHE
jgi:signal transduction histidine kinase/ActR/RegA family two-component response regulator